MTNREIKLELAKIVLGRLEHADISDAKKLYFWITHDDVQDVELEEEESADISSHPISEVTNRIVKHDRKYESSGTRFHNIVTKNEIKTVGDLLKLGRVGFLKLYLSGQKLAQRVGEALEELYGITNW